VQSSEVAFYICILQDNIELPDGRVLFCSEDTSKLYYASTMLQEHHKGIVMLFLVLASKFISL